MNILVLGGAGYIGSHFYRQAIKKGHKVVVYDNLSRGFAKSLPSDALIIEKDITQTAELTKAIDKHQIQVLMHFAAFALVGESVAAPELYYHNNVVGTLSVLEAMVAAKVSPSLVFSSSCAVFGSPKNLPISENDPKSPESPYGHTKHMCEQMISDFCHAHGLKAIALRYFNACGASDDGSIGEAHDPETHLIPILIKAAIDGKAMKIFGGDFETKDGTCVRDYIHIDDLALSHLKAAQVMEDKDPSYYEAIHLGTGQGYSNLEILEKVEEILGKKIEHEVTDRRAGDSAALYANNQRAKEVLDFKTEFSDLHTIISSAIAWHQASPNGYAK